ncbi:hypothetical protein CYMTET_37031 [Cymbomonas tetramitiformis]|uniref:Phytanoyl-CoA dioxygenase family protein n=1 Tax=Cymbomonas tetramitiformis TaxID=36881 RepID=A0AAE0CBP3_9CHLO|nr:hypothetical protein CYMTET_38631 [Cymbomonas tetramitiformis]KAK3253696.1 hypothetical protein CYMTET_37031 [Cymbomonas tetramitiformis]
MNGESDSSVAQELAREGYVVRRLFDESQTDALCESFKLTLGQLPEYKVREDWRYSKTGFGALGTASSFHNRFVRAMRLVAHAQIAPVMAEVDGVDELRASVGPVRNPRRWLFRQRFRGYRRRESTEKPRRLHQLYDRMLVRTENQHPTAEDWHQDLSVYSDGDTVYGGWIAFTDQQARLIPRTQHLHAPGAGFQKKKKAELDEVLPHALTVEVPRGCIFLMNQRLVHAVLPSKIRTDPMCRLFTAWRLTHDDRSLLEVEDRNRNSRQDGLGAAQKLDDVMREMEVPKIPSNQLPSMYNVRNVDDPKQRERLRSWCEGGMQDAVRTHVPMYADGKTPKRPRNLPPEQAFKIPELHAPSISTLRGLPRDAFDRAIHWEHLFPEYAAVERAILEPHRPRAVSAVELKTLARELLPALDGLK